MRKLLVLAFLLSPLLARAQGVLIPGSVTVNTTVSNVPGFTSALQTVSNATVTVCSSSGGGTPCTPTATIYSNSALTTTATNPLAACVGAATQGCIDNLGNYSFWVAPNNSGYLVSQTGPTIVGKLFAVSAPATESATETFTNKTLTSPTITNPTTTGTDAGTETLSNKTLPSPTITGTVAGGASYTAPTITNPSTTGTDSGTETLQNKTLIGAANGNGVTLVCPFQGALAAVTGTAAIQAIYTCNVTANVLGAGKGLRVNFGFTHSTGSATDKASITVGGTNSTELTCASGAAARCAATWAVFNNPSVQNAQTLIAWPVGDSSGLSGNAFDTSAVNFANAITITANVDVAGTDQNTPKYFWVELMQ